MRYEIQDPGFKNRPGPGKGGFTIIETLVAITILMIAIAGPLTVASQALHAALDARSQMVATNLAQEMVEEVRNYKDNNISGNTLAGLFSRYLDPNGKYIVEVDPYTSYVFNSCLAVSNGDCALYLSPDTGYTYVQDAGVNSPFSRWFSLAQITPTEFLLTVTVAWSTGSLSNQIQVKDLLSANTR